MSDVFRFFCCSVPATLLLAVVSALVGGEADVIPHRQDRVPNRPYSPEEAIARMTVPPGFQVELVAAEPDIVNPVAMTFDDRGRIWIAESLEYPRRSSGVGRDRIKILEDTDQDGRADKVTIFAEGLNIPSGIAVGHGGVWVLNAPDLLFIKEQDGREVSREVVVTGFGRTDVHELPNSLTWGPDGWLYGLNGVFNHSRVESEGKVYEFTCAMFRVHPQTHRFELVCEGTSNPWGLVWDPEGSALVSACHWANDHIFHFVETGYYQRQAGPYPSHTMIIGSVSDHSHQKTAYCGLAYFDSDAYPAEYRDRLYLGNIHGACINVDVLERDGATYRSREAPDFLAAHDAWFMPVSQKVGPDGCLYVLDWYDRYHCYQDANRDPEGIDRLKGRLYRVRYQDSPRAPAFDLGQESDDQLIARLASPNIFFRESAQRLLSERASPSLSKKLAQVVFDEQAPSTARRHALWALIGGGPLEQEVHQRLLASPDSTYRAWGVRAAGNMRQVAPAIRERVAGLSRDPAPEVLLQVAIAARKIDGIDPLPILVDVLSACGQDKLIPSIVWPNLHPLLEQDAARFIELAAADRFGSGSALARLLPRAVVRVLSAAEPDLAAVGQLLELALERDPEQARECLSQLSAKARELPDSVVDRLRDELRVPLQRLQDRQEDEALALAARLLSIQLGNESEEIESVRRIFLSADEQDSDRLSAFDALIVYRHTNVLDDVRQVLAAASPEFARQVLHLLGQLDDPKVADLVIDHYAGLPAEIQPLAIDLLMQRERWVRRLLEAIKRERMPAKVLSANHLLKIMDTNDREAIWAVEAAWGQVRQERNPGQESVVAEMREYLQNASGDPFAGQRAFEKLCAQCHKIYGQGADVGPDLTTNGRASFEQLLSNVFDPSLVIGPGYQTVLVVTKDGRNLTGLVAENSDQRIVLKLPGGQLEAVTHNNIKFTKVSPLSMMPEGIEHLYDRQELADLFAFLCLDGPPGEPGTRPILGAPDFGQESEPSGSQVGQ